MYDWNELVRKLDETASKLDHLYGRYQVSLQGDQARITAESTGKALYVRVTQSPPSAAICIDSDADDSLKEVFDYIREHASLFEEIPLFCLISPDEDPDGKERIMTYNGDDPEELFDAAVKTLTGFWPYFVHTKPLPKAQPEFYDEGLFLLDDEEENPEPEDLLREGDEIVTPFDDLEAEEEKAPEVPETPEAQGTPEENKEEEKESVKEEVREEEKEPGPQPLVIPPSLPWKQLDYEVKLLEKKNNSSNIHLRFRISDNRPHEFFFTVTDASGCRRTGHLVCRHWFYYNLAPLSAQRRVQILVEEGGYPVFKLITRFPVYMHANENENSEAWGTALEEEEAVVTAKPVEPSEPEQPRGIVIDPEMEIRFEAISGAAMSLLSKGV